MVVTVSIPKIIKIRSNAKDLTGKQFGRLTAKYPCKRSKQNGIYWYCECKCGGTSVVRSSHLSNGNVSNCGGKGNSCKRKELLDISGQRFGHLTAIRLMERKAMLGGPTSKFSYRWLCVCDCGNDHDALRSSLLNSDSWHCGCKFEPWIKHGKCGTQEYSIYHGAKQRANLKSLPFDLQLGSISIPDLCPVFKTPLVRGENSICLDSPTIDRLIPSLGYTKKILGSLAIGPIAINPISRLSSCENVRSIR